MKFKQYLKLKLSETQSGREIHADSLGDGAEVGDIIINDNGGRAQVVSVGTGRSGDGIYKCVALTDMSRDQVHRGDTHSIPKGYYFMWTSDGIKSVTSPKGGLKEDQLAEAKTRFVNTIKLEFDPDRTSPKDIASKLCKIIAYMATAEQMDNLDKENIGWFIVDEEDKIGSGPYLSKQTAISDSMFKRWYKDGDYKFVYGAEGNDNKIIVKNDLSDANVDAQNIKEISIISNQIIDDLRDELESMNHVGNDDIKAALGSLKK